MKSRAILSLLASSVLTLTLCESVSAYRLMRIPTADVLAPGEPRLEVQSQSLSTDHANLYRVDVGTEGAFELQISHFVRTSTGTKDIIGIEKQLVPETGLTPAIAVGMMDVANVAEKGRTPYAVASLSPPIEALHLPIHSMQVHAGVGGGFFLGAFAGASFDLPLGLGFEVEHDSHGFNYAGTWSPIKLVKVRVMSVSGDQIYSVIISPRSK